MDSSPTPTTPRRPPRLRDLWEALPPELRLEAAQALYEAGRRDAALKVEADHAVAEALRFRVAKVRQLPAARRVELLARRVRPDDDLLFSLFMALHLQKRRPLLAAFLDALGLPHDDGVLHDPDAVDAPPPAKLQAAVETIRRKFPPDAVRLYLRCLYAMDPVLWEGLGEVLPALDDAPSGPTPAAG